MKLFGLLIAIAVITMYAERIDASQSLNISHIEQPAPPNTLDAVPDPGPAPAPNHQEIVQPRQQQASASNTDTVIVSRHAKRQAIKASKQQTRQANSYSSMRFSISKPVQFSAVNVAASSQRYGSSGCTCGSPGCNCGK